MTVSIQFNLNNPEDARNAMLALQVFTKGLYGDSILQKEAKKPETVIVLPDRPANAPTVTPSKIPANDVVANGPLISNADYFNVNLDKQRFTPEDRKTIEMGCAANGIDISSKTSTVNLAKALKKAIETTAGKQDGTTKTDWLEPAADPKAEPTKAEPVKTPDQLKGDPGKVDMVDLRNLVKGCVDAIGKEKTLTLMESRCGSKTLSGMDTLKHKLLASACRASVSFKHFIDVKGETEGSALLVLVGGPGCKNLAGIGDDKLGAFAAVCEEKING